MNHPLKVYHPGKGEHYVCRWWTHNEQHQLIVAPTKQALRHVWESAYKRYNDAEAKELYRVELVAPSNLMCSKAIAYKREADIKSFMNEVTGHIQKAVKLGLPVPPQFTACPGWASSYEDDDDREPDSTTLKYHLDCRNCTNTFALVGLTPEQFYDKFSAAWDEIHPPKKGGGGRYKAVYSTANAASDDEVIYEASTSSFGHHKAGVELVECGGEPPWHNAHPWGFFHDVLFYFRFLQELSVEPYNQAAAAYRSEQKRLAKARRQLEEARRQIEERQAAEKSLAVFMRGE